MKKKVKDCTTAELTRFCETSRCSRCKDCPFLFKDEFGFEECFLELYTLPIPNDILEKEIEIPEEEENE